MGRRGGDGGTAAGRRLGAGGSRRRSGALARGRPAVSTAAQVEAEGAATEAIERPFLSPLQGDEHHEGHHRRDEYRHARGGSNHIGVTETVHATGASEIAFLLQRPTTAPRSPYQLVGSSAGSRAC